MLGWLVWTARSGRVRDRGVEYTCRKLEARTIEAMENESRWSAAEQLAMAADVIDVEAIREHALGRGLDRDFVDEFLRPPSDVPRQWTTCTGGSGTRNDAAIRVGRGRDACPTHEESRTPPSMRARGPTVVAQSAAGRRSTDEAMGAFCVIPSRPRQGRLEAAGGSVAQHKGLS